MRLKITKTTTLDIITFLLVVLFIYAAVSKLLDYEMFKAQIGRSPLITNYAALFAWLVPAVEIVISLLLIVPQFRLAGLFGSFSLMFAFTAYIIFILTLSPSVPCSCGGILSAMGWTEHLVFNIVFTLLTIVGVALQTKQTQNKVIPAHN